MHGFFVYIFVDHNTGNPIYVGKGKDKRDLQHKANACNGKVTRLYNWMRKYKNMNGVWPKPFRIAEGLNEQEAFGLEIAMIEFWGREDLKTGCLFNLTNGGEGGVEKSPETLAKISAKKKGSKMSPESIAKRTASVIGRKNTPETIQRMRDAAIGRKMSPEAVIKIIAAIKARKPISMETRNKLSAAQKGKPSWWKGKKLSPEVRAKMSDAHKRRRYSDDASKTFNPVELHTTL